jgi:anti-sigma factor RsiW
MREFIHRLRFRLDHRWAPGRMSAYLDAELGQSGRARMDRHTAECPQCRRLIASLRRMLSALHRLPAPAGGADGLDIASSVRLRLGGPRES